MLSVKDSEDREVGIFLGEVSDFDSLLRSASTGEHRVGPLPPGAYRVTAVGRAGETKTKRVKLKPGVERKLTLRLE